MNTNSLLRRTSHLLSDLHALQQSRIALHKDGTPSIHAYVATQMLIDQTKCLQHRLQCIQRQHRPITHINGPIHSPNPLTRALPESAQIIFGD